ncbi:DAK2 domain-containing protein, partial [Kitasatospora sp. NPDC058243]|uniref:DAK2 domain-containing protein n=1 Tax=Kitasatospora sp. NPDC058243 TaxID=3346397 RepID=UPI0036DCB4FF
GVGEARRGEKTLVNARHQAKLALRSDTPGPPPDTSPPPPTPAAAAGVRRTRALRARRGRASYLGERASGVPDPGAVGIALLFASAHAVPRTLDGVLLGDSAADSASADTVPTDTASTDTAFDGPDPLCGPEPAPAGP